MGVTAVYVIHSAAVTCCLHM